MLKPIYIASLILLFDLMNPAYAERAKFKINSDHFIPTLGNCYMDSCSWSKGLAVKIIQQSSEQLILQVNLLGGESIHTNGRYPRSYREAKIKWNNKPHSIVITCSYAHPSIAINGQLDELPLGAQGVPDVLISEASLYFEYCHSSSRWDQAEKFGYNLTDMIN